MADRRQLPVEHGDQPRRMRVEDHVVDPPVAMHQRDAAVVGRNVRSEPGQQALHVLDTLGFARPILLGPALHLAGEVRARLAEVGEADRADVDRVEF